MKRSDLRIIISAVAKRVRETFTIMKGNIDQVAVRVNATETKLEDLHKSVLTRADVESICSAIIKSLSAPEIKMPEVMTADEIAAVCAKTLPSQADIVRDVLAQLPKPEKGEKGDKGESVTAGDVLSLIELPAVPTVEEVTAAVMRNMPTAESIAEMVKAAIPAPEKGEKGDKGDKGDSPTIDFDQIKATLTELVKQIPAPKDGASVTLDDVLPAIESQFAKWALDFERRATDKLDRMKGIDGEDGEDGLGFDDLKNLKFDFVTERELSITVTRDEKTTELTKIKLTHPIYRGIWKPDAVFDKGDTVTRDGCMWIALTDNPQGAPTDGTSKDWQQATKRGRDGQDFKPKGTQSTQVRVAPRKET